MITTQPPLKLVCKINYKQRGFRERYFLAETDYTAAKPIAAGLCQLRRSMFALGVTMDRASIHFANSERDMQPVILRPISHTPQMAASAVGAPLIDHTINDYEVGLQYIMTTPEGRWANRLFRFIPDYWSDDAEPAFLEDLTPAEGDAPAFNPATFASLSLGNTIRHFLRYVLKKTRYVKEVAPNGAGQRQWDVREWSEMAFEQIGDRDTGGPSVLSRGRR